MPVFSPATGNPAARLIQRPSVPSLAPPMVLPSVQAAAQRAPATKIERTYWTKRRVQDGLRRFWIDKQQTPTSSEAYHELTQPHGATGRAPGRYPSFYAVLRWFPSFRAAWESIGLQQDRWWEHWSELDDWYLREGAGILTRKELAADLRRSPDAVHRRLYDLGIHTWERWGWSAYRIQRAAGISESVLRRYMRRGELPYLRGSRVVYVDPADLPIVEEINWADTSTELVEQVKAGLRQRIVATISGGDWRVGRVHTPHPERLTGVRWKLKLARPTQRPTAIVVHDLVRTTRPALSRPNTIGRVGQVKAVFWSGVRSGVREQVEPGWFARVEFTHDQLPRAHATLPIAMLERVEVGP